MSEKPGAPPCGLYYRLNKTDDDTTRAISDFLRDIRQISMMINRTSGYERNMYVIEIQAGSFSDEDTALLIDTIQSGGGVALLSGDIEGVDKDSMNADGIVLNDVKRLSEIRTKLGDDFILGVSCSSSKDLAEEALKQGADFIAFGIQNYGLPDIKLLSWWADLTEKPALALGEITNDSCGLLARSGAGFVDVTAYLDTHEDGIMKAAANVLYALSLADE